MQLAERPSLLITDDDRDFRETMGELFQPRGFRTYLAGDGQEALEIVEREAIHLLVTDMHMPRLSGLEMIRRLRAARASLPCILVSAELSDELIAELEQAGVFGYLSKPVSSRQVTSLVTRALEAAYGWRLS